MRQNKTSTEYICDNRGMKADMPYKRWQKNARCSNINVR